MRHPLPYSGHYGYVVWCNPSASPHSLDCSPAEIYVIFMRISAIPIVQSKQGVRYEIDGRMWLESAMLLILRVFIESQGLIRAYFQGFHPGVFAD